MLSVLLVLAKGCKESGFEITKEFLRILKFFIVFEVTDKGYQPDL